MGTGVYDNEMHPAYSMEASQEGFAMGHSDNNIPAAQPNRPGYGSLYHKIGMVCAHSMTSTHFLQTTPQPKHRKVSVYGGSLQS